MKVLTLFGTRPEIIKLAPVIRALAACPSEFRCVNVSSGQHDSLLAPFVRQFGIRVDHDLRVMQPDQTPTLVLARLLPQLDQVLMQEAPDAVLVQGDTTTALAGAIAAFHRHVRIGHVEAGLRTGDPHNPFPEEMNRRLISRMAYWHFAATPSNRETLLREGTPPNRVVVTGNPVVDALHSLSVTFTPSPLLRQTLAAVGSTRIIVLTTHRRESFGAPMIENLKALAHFVCARPTVSLVFPVHPNPAVRQATEATLAGRDRVHLLPPLDYGDFVHLLSNAWLIVSDSGGVQEEAPSLGVPLLVLRENTERPEVLESGVAKLVGNRPGALASCLQEAFEPGSWAEAVPAAPNPFGSGDAARRILLALLAAN